jgi:hypothetical protein
MIKSKKKINVLKLFAKNNLFFKNFSFINMVMIKNIIIYIPDYNAHLLS